MKLQTITVKNFLSIGEATLKLADRGLILIDGKNTTNTEFQSNGSAKSSMLEAVTYALYGKTTTGMTADDVINRKVGKKTEVVLTFTSNDKEYTITRGRKKNKVHLHQGENDLTGATTKVTDATIEEIVGIPYNIYVNALFFGQGNVKPISTLTDKELKELLESLVDLEVYTRAHEIIKEDISEATQMVTSTEARLSGVKQALVYAQEQQQAQKQQQEAKREQKKSLELAIVDAQALKDTALNVVTESQSATAEITQQATVAIEEINQKLNTTSSASVADEYQSREQTYQNNLRMATQAHTEAVRLIESLTTTLLGYQAEYNACDTSDVCVTCGSVWDAEHKEEEKARITALITETATGLIDSKNELPVLQQAQVTANEHHQEALRQLQEERQKASEVNSQYQALVNERAQLQHNIQQAEFSTQTAKQQLETAERNVATLTARLQEEDVEAPAIDLSGLTSEISALEKTITDTIAKKQRLTEMAVAFSNAGIKSHVLELITPFLNEQVNKYLAKLTGSSIEVVFATQTESAKGNVSEKFSMTVNNLQGGLKYNSNSAGERRRVDLAVSLALQDLVMKRSDLQVNALFYDEVFDGLDSVGCENVVELLQERLGDVTSIFVITHNENLKPLFNNTITMIKEDGISRLEEGRNEN